MPGNHLQYLNANDWILIGAKSTRRTYKLGDGIIRQGSSPVSIFIIRRGEASVELAGTNSRVIVASLGPGDVCGEIGFLEKSRATAEVVAKEDVVEADEIDAQELRELFDAYSGLASRFYHSLALLLAARLRETSRALAREMALRDQKK
jgi:CRP-like cAMP-binding protein